MELLTNKDRKNIAKKIRAQKNRDKTKPMSLSNCLFLAIDEVLDDDVWFNASKQLKFDILADLVEGDVKDNPN